MKTFKYLLFAFIAAFVGVGCSDDPTYTPGDGEDPNSYGVYFPKQENATDVELDPADPTVLEFTARRKNFKDAITVPVEVTSSEEGLFAVSEIKFEPGQQETTFRISFDGAEIGKTYKCTLLVSDKKYANLYGEYSNGLTFTVTRIEWVLLKGPNGETKGLWRDDFFTSMMGSANIHEGGIPNAEKEVEIYERPDMPGYYRIKDIYDDDYMYKICAARYRDVHPVSTYTIIDARDKDKVWFPVQSAGFQIEGYDDNGMFVIVSMCKENYPTIASATRYGKLENGVITFPPKAILCSLPSIWEETSYYKANTEMTRLMLPGAKVFNYELMFSAQPSADGKVAIAATLGSDIAKVKYAYFEGRLSASVVASKAIDIDAGTVASQEISASGTITAQLEETGIYTLVGVGYNDAGVMQTNSSVTFGYVKAGEDKPVVMSVRTELTWEKEAQGHTPFNSIKGIVFGEEIQSGYYGLIKTSQIQGMSEEKLIALVKGGNPIEEDDIAEINANGWVPFFINLAKGTSYTLLVYADNGYYGKMFAVEQTTQGDPSPLDIIYTFDDAKAGVPKADLFNTTWNYYAVDVAEGKTSREFIGTVTCSENPNDGVDEEDNTPLDFINIKGLSGLLGVQGYTGTDEMTAIWDSPGIVYPEAMCDLGMYSKYYVSNYFLWEEKPTGLHTIRYAMEAVYVADGIVAFVPNPGYVEMNYTFTGIYIGAFESREYGQPAGYLSKYKHLLLVHPDADPNKKTAASVTKTIDELKPTTNYVELRGPALVRTIWNEKAAQNLAASGSVTEAEVSNPAVTPLTSTYSNEIVRPAGDATYRNMPLQKFAE